MEEQTQTTTDPANTQPTEPATDNPTLENNGSTEPAATTPGGDEQLLGGESVSITAEQLEELLKEYTNTKTDVTVLVDEAAGREAVVQVVHSVTLGDIYIIALLFLLVITTLLTRVIGRR